MRDKIWKKASFDKRTLSRIFADEIQYKACSCILAGGSGAGESRRLEKQQGGKCYRLLLDIVCVRIPCWCTKPRIKLVGIIDVFSVSMDNMPKQNTFLASSVIRGNQIAKGI